MAREWIGGDPPQEVIAEMCSLFQRSWTEAERDKRSGLAVDSDEAWTVPQYLVHHCETGRWQKGRDRKVQIWRRADGR
jgi:hypothetical protein